MDDSKQRGFPAGEDLFSEGYAAPADQRHGGVGFGPLFPNILHFPQIVLAWVLAQKPWIVPIPGTTKLHRLEENPGAAHIALSAKELIAMEEASSKIKVVGDCYTYQMEKSTGL